MEQANICEVSDKSKNLNDSANLELLDNAVESNNVTINQETADKSETSPNENEQNTTTECSNEQTSNISRELKSLLALSKESNMDTNISHKRKSFENVRYKEFATSEADDGKKKSKTFNVNSFPVTAESELLSESSIDVCMKTYENDIHFKRKRDSMNESPVEGAGDHSSKKNRKPLLSSDDSLEMFPGKDKFCWRCHHDNVNIACETCPRAYHQKCLKQTIGDPLHWPCPECVAILKAENTQTRSEAMKGMTLEHLCGLLKFAIKRMIKCQGTEPFMHPVCNKTFPDYKKYITQPMDLTQIEKNIKQNIYGSTQAFEADAKWILHNSIIFNSYQSKLTSAAKQIIRICKQEMAEIENCPSCYLNANTKTETWFVEVCPKPHILIWAKLKGFPYWPAKAMSINSSGMVDVRFFGAHDRSWVSYKDCFLYCRRDPNSQKHRKHDIGECIKEMELYIDNLRNIYGEFHYAPFKTLYDPDPNNETKQIQLFLPKYRPDSKPKALKLKIKMNMISPSISPKPDKKSSENLDNERSTPKKPSEDVNNESSVPEKSSEDLNNEHLVPEKVMLTNCGSKDTTQKGDGSDSCMEGYGTDDESCSDVPLERRKRLIRLISNSTDKEDIEGEQEDGLDSEISNIELESKIKGKPSKTSRSFDSTNSDSPVAKLQRRNSDISTKSDTSIFEKINLVEAPGEAESINKENSFTSSQDEPSLQIDSDALQNTELSNNPPVRLSIAEQLMKRLQESSSLANEPTDDIFDETEDLKFDKSDSFESIKPEDSQVISSTSNSQENNLEKTENTPEIDHLSKVEDIGIFNKEIVTTICNKINLTSESEVTSSGSTEKTMPEQDNIKNIEKVENEPVLEKTDVSEIIGSKNSSVLECAKNKCDKVDTEKKSTKYMEDVQVAIVESLDDSDLQQSLSLDNSQIDQNMIRDIIHSSLNGVNATLPKITKPNDDSESELNKVQSSSIVEKQVECQSIESNKRKLSSDCESRQSPPLKLTKIILSQNLSSSSSNIDPLEKTTSNSHTRQDNLSTTKTNRNVSNAEEIINSNQVTNEPLSSTNLPLNSENYNELSPLEIKSEPESETESIDPAYIEAKRKYLSALNISERSDELNKKPQEIRTRSKTEDVRFNISHGQDNVSKVIDSVASSCGLSGVKKNINKTGEIYVKPFFKMQAHPPTIKQKARKTFPTPNYSKPKVLAKANIVHITKPNSCNGKSENSQTSSNNILVYSTTQQPISSNVALLTTNQSVPFTSNLNTNQVFTVVSQSPTTTSSKTPSQVITYNPVTGKLTTITPVKQVNYNNSQNYIPQKDRDNQEKDPLNTSSNSSPSTSNNNITNSTNNTESTSESSVNSNNESVLSNLLNDRSLLVPNLVQNPGATSEIINNSTNNDFSILNNVLPENICKSLSNSLCRPPPKLKPRPPGPLNTFFEESLPSSAGPVTSKINSVSHRLGDYFRGMLVELLEELGKSDSSEATITSLKMEIEALKHKHAVEINEMKSNITTTLLDIQKSIVEDRERILQETRAQCEAETIKRIEEAKSKQWCSNCSKEAQFYCCWNTSYCDYPCQQKHWSKHMGKCTQNSNSSTQIFLQPTQSTGSPVPRQNNQQKSIPRIVSKPTKVYVNRAPGKNITTYKASPGSQLTLVESTPGNYELQGIGPVAVSGKLIANNVVNKFKTTNVLSVSSPSSSTSNFVKKTSNVQQVKSPAMTNVHSSVTIINDDSN